MPSRLRFDQPASQQRQRNRTERHDQADPLAAFLPDEDSEHDAAHADDGQHRTHRIDVTWPGVFHVADEPDARQHDAR